jgi:hypothetical protein
MSEFDPRGGTHWEEEVSFRRLDGVERVPVLPFAHMLAVAPAVEPDDPAYVFIEWTPGQVERPIPGSALWRAALNEYLATADPSEPQAPQLRMAVAQSLAHFPSLEAWFRWRDHDRRPPREPPPHRARLGWSRLRWPW